MRQGAVLGGRQEAADLRAAVAGRGEELEVEGGSYGVVEFDVELVGVADALEGRDSHELVRLRLRDELVRAADSVPPADTTPVYRVGTTVCKNFMTCTS